jgi:hypothetical protein
VKRVVESCGTAVAFILESSLPVAANIGEQV